MLLKCSGKYIDIYFSFKITSAIGLAMFCKQRRFGTPRTVHHTKSWLKLSFYRSIRIYRVDFEKIYISSMLFFPFF